ncbi:hypothetical protein C8R45DRAFT_408601 [Mycena sanguinolenta]|nr:hypothetical protein C8R45DRAFT_408601 [Mycena sanguinolenta]
MMSSSYADSQSTSDIIRSFTSPNTPALENLFRYHKHKTQLLSAVFSNIEKHVVALVENSGHQFVTDITTANRRIQRLERSLRGGSLAVWFQFEESQEELSDIQDTLLARHENSTWNDRNKKEFNKRIDDASKEDSARMRRKIQDVVEKFQSHRHPRKNLFGISRRPILPLDELFPVLKDPDLRKRDEAYRVATLHWILGEFENASLIPSNLSTLLRELNSYIQSQITSLEVDVVSSSPANIQIIRKPSGAIVAILFGSKSRDAIRKYYYRDPKVKDGKLPILYTVTKTVGEITSEFLVARQAITSRPDSLKYEPWESGDAPSTNIYLVEKPAGADTFILATLLGSNVQSDVLKTLPRADRLIQDVIRLPNEHPWIAEDGWINWGMSDLRCDSGHFTNYGHQIFVKGPPAPVSSVDLAGEQSLRVP